MDTSVLNLRAPGFRRIIAGPNTGRMAVFVIAAVVLLSGLDAVLTLRGIAFGAFIERNPLLHAALDVHPLLFLLGKGGLTFFWAAISYAERRRVWLLAVNAVIGTGYLIVVLRSGLHLFDSLPFVI